MEKQQFSINAALGSVRQEFDRTSLLEEQCDKNPFVQFESWLADAMGADPNCANAMALSTVSESGMPDSRIVLLRNVSFGGLTFFTNYHSAKGRQLAANAGACALFFWKELERQVRVQGQTRQLPAHESDEYFEARPFESKVGAWASRQSQPVKNRESLDALYNAELARFGNGAVPRPPHWGGYVLLPSSFEFWQGRAGRLHDRLRYTRQGESGAWLLERLMP